MTNNIDLSSLIRQLQEAWEGTTQGEWRSCGDGYRGNEIHSGSSEQQNFQAIAYVYGLDDSAFVILSHNLMPQIIAKLREAEETIRELEQDRKDMGMLVRELLRRSPTEARKRVIQGYLERKGLQGSILRDGSEAAGDGWQPISTAPKDGTRILVDDGHTVYISFWLEGDELNKEGWVRGLGFREPIRWQPLPSRTAPASRGENQ